jgi:hypothetical protein
VTKPTLKTKESMTNFKRETESVVIRPLTLRDYNAWRESHLSKLPRLNLWDTEPPKTSQLSKRKFESLIQIQRRFRKQDRYYNLGVFDKNTGHHVGFVSAMNAEVENLNFSISRNTSAMVVVPTNPGASGYERIEITHIDFETGLSERSTASPDQNCKSRQDDVYRHNQEGNDYATLLSALCSHPVRLCC